MIRAAVVGLGIGQMHIWSMRRMQDRCTVAAAGDLEPLLAFHAAARRIVEPNLDRFEQVWRGGPARAAAETGELLAAMRAGSAEHLGGGSVHRLAPPGPERRMGCCGTLGTYVP